jgi:hypothetical protein
MVINATFNNISDISWQSVLFILFFCNEKWHNNKGGILLQCNK